MSYTNIASVPHVVAATGWIVGDGVTPIPGRFVGGNAVSGVMSIYDGDPAASPPGALLGKVAGGAGGDFPLEGRYVPFVIGLYAACLAGASGTIYTEGS